MAMGAYTDEDIRLVSHTLIHNPSEFTAHHQHMHRAIRDYLTHKDLDVDLSTWTSDISVETLRNQPWTVLHDLMNMVGYSDRSEPDCVTNAYEDAVADHLVRVYDTYTQPIQYVSYPAGGMLQDCIIAARLLHQRPYADIDVHLIDLDEYAYVHNTQRPQSESQYPAIDQCIGSHRKTEVIEHILQCAFPHATVRAHLYATPAEFRTIHEAHYSQHPYVVSAFCPMFVHAAMCCGGPSSVHMALEPIKCVCHCLLHNTPHVSCFTVSGDYEEDAIICRLISQPVDETDTEHIFDMIGNAEDGEDLSTHDPEGILREAYNHGITVYNHLVR